jgi:transposase
MIGLTPINTIYVSRHATDLRKSIDGLCGCVEEIFHQDPFNGNLFVFFNKRMTMVKMLLWSKDGFCIFMKRLERGTFSLKTLADSGNIHVTELLCILDGIDLYGSRCRKRYSLPQK